MEPLKSRAYLYRYMAPIASLIVVYKGFLRVHWMGINNFGCKSDRLLSRTASIKALAFLCNSKKRNPQSQGISHT
ncbi:hypothetical protein QUB25_08370 [Microcoleus sp. B3-D7]